MTQRTNTISLQSSRLFEVFLVTVRSKCSLFQKSNFLMNTFQALLLFLTASNNIQQQSVVSLLIYCL